MFGSITHTIDTAPLWAENVGAFDIPSSDTDYLHGYVEGLPITAYSTRGQVYSSCFVLTRDGKINVYGEDKSKLINKNEKMYFNLYF